MKIKDEALWQQQRAEFAQDPNPMAVDFEKFVTTWAELAESARAASRVASQDGQTDVLSPIEALRRTLRRAERIAGHWTIGFLGHALITLMSHWTEIENPQEFAESLTPIEANLLADTVDAWKAEMNRQAQANTQ